MRPYMLWLARVYAGDDQAGSAEAGVWWVSPADWVAHQQEQRMYVREALRVSA